MQRAGCRPIQDKDAASDLYEPDLIDSVDHVLLLSAIFFLSGSNNFSYHFSGELMFQYEAKTL